MMCLKRESMYNIAALGIEIDKCMYCTVSNYTFFGFLGMVFCLELGVFEVSRSLLLKK